VISGDDQSTPTQSFRPRFLKCIKLRRAWGNRPLPTTVLKLAGGPFLIGLSAGMPGFLFVNRNFGCGLEPGTCPHSLMALGIRGGGGRELC